MNPKLKIRHAVPADSDAVAEVHIRSIKVLDFLPQLHTVEEVKVYFSKVVAEEQVYVAEDKTGPVGFIGETENWINHLWVLPENFRQGIGSALLVSAQQRQSLLQLWCFQKNTPARRFYESHGFQAVKYTDGAGNEEKEPDVLYEWKRN